MEDVSPVLRATPNRRAFLTAATLVATGAAASNEAGASQAKGPEPTVVFEDQQSDGSSVVVAEVATDADTALHVVTEERDILVTLPMSAGEQYTDLIVDLERSIEESQELRAFIPGTSQGDVGDRAMVTVGEAPGNLVGMDPTLIEADPDAGFEYPYFLCAPTKSPDAEPIPPLLEPTNTGRPSDDMDVHVEAGRETVESGFSQRIAAKLGTPLVVPVFPRPETTPVDATHYVHALDDTTMAIDEGPLERIDLQVLSMVEDARRQLAERDYPVDDGLMLNGFSASGNFVDRFAVLHPERVTSVTAGGLNGMPLLPLSTDAGRTLPFHVGIADVEALTGSPVDLDALDGVNQFLYMGAEDDNDTIPYDDAWTDDDLRQLALDVYGDHMIEERFPRSQAAYDEAGVAATFRVYGDAGHTPAPAEDDVVAFHRRSIRGEPVTDLGEEIQSSLAIERTPTDAAPGEEIVFDASGSTGGTSDISRYLWDSGTGDTAYGEQVTYTYENAGEQTVTLTVVYESGTEDRLTGSFSVGTSSDGSGGDGAAADDTAGEEDGATAADSATHTDGEGGTGGNGTADEADETPGFGLPGALLGIGGAGYLLRRRRSERNPPDE